MPADENIEYVQRGGISHATHLLVTLLTGGLWLPVWILAAIVGPRKRYVKKDTGPGVGSGFIAWIKAGMPEEGVYLDGPDAGKPVRGDAGRD